MDLPDGLFAVVKRSCPTCQLVAPVLLEVKQAGTGLRVYSQDEPGFPPGVDAVVDGSLELSFRLGVEAVPTLVRRDGGREVGRAVGWERSSWQSLTGVPSLGASLPASRPGCGAKNVEPGIAEELAVRYGAALRSRWIEAGELEDEAELLFERGWTDGLPVTAPTPARVMRMLEGTRRSSAEVIGVVAPSGAEATIEKVAINAVLAGCKPQYLPVVLAAVEAACAEEFNSHGLIATTWFAGPLVVVNGKVAREIGMASGVNCLGQGNRANATIGRALQLVLQNIGGGRPGEVDLATLGHPGKYTFCFAEREEDSPWEPLATERAEVPVGAGAVTLFAASGVQGVADQRSRQPESLAKSFAACLRTVFHPKIAIAVDAMLIVSPEHARVFVRAGWSKARLRHELESLLELQGSDIVQGAGGMEEGMPAYLAEGVVPKFRPGGLLIVHAGGNAGLYSAVIGGWASGGLGSEPVTRRVRS